MKNNIINTDMRNIYILILSIFLPCFPQTFLKGELHGTFPKDNYIVSGDIVVKKGDALIFEAGSELRFQPLTGIKVYGVFLANGTKENGIVFSLLKNDADASKKWSGLTIADTSAYVYIAYSIFCDAETAIDLGYASRKVVFNSVVFYKNGSANIFSQGSPVLIKDEVSYIYNGTGGKPIAVVEKNDSLPLLNANYGDMPVQKQSNPWYVPARWSLSAIVIGGTGLWLGGYYKAEKYNRQYHLQNTISGTQDIRRKRDNWAEIQNIGMVLCGIGSGCFSVTFFF